MAKAHKAPTQVSIASTEAESDLRDFVTRYWPHAAGLAVVITGVILFRQNSAASAESHELEAWGQLGLNASFDEGFGSVSVPSASIIGDVANQVSDSSAGPWAKALEVGKRLRDDDLAGARAALDELKTNWPDHALVRDPLFARKGEDGPARSLANHVNSTVAALEAWKEAHPFLFQQPALPADAPRVRLNTSAGSMVVGLYEEYAPEHAANFLKLCKEGFYDGTKFHRVIADFMIQAGDPNSKTEESDENTWGQGGPGFTLEPEVGSVWHFKGALAAAATMAGGPTSGSQFYIVTGADGRHELDGDYTVFGMLLEGEDVAATIEGGAVLGDKPQEPVTIESTEVLSE